MGSAILAPCILIGLCSRSLRGPKTMTEFCREHDIADSLLRKWREQFLAAGAERLQGKSERTEPDELGARSAAWSGRGGSRR